MGDYMQFHSSVLFRMLMSDSVGGLSEHFIDIRNTYLVSESALFFFLFSAILHQHGLLIPASYLWLYRPPLTLPPSPPPTTTTTWLLGKTKYATLRS